MIDLAAFLAARWDEDEAAAKAAMPGPWKSRNLGRHDAGALIQLTGYLSEFRIPQGPVIGTFDGWGRAAATASHVARYDPPRVFREIDAKRAILAELDRLGTSLAPGAVRMRLLYDAALRHYAAVYSDHPDYLQEWTL